ncbi:two-component system sensor histidine kinase AlgZ [Oxalobacteraceae bacterium GrIS 1.11]
MSATSGWLIRYRRMMREAAIRAVIPVQAKVAPAAGSGPRPCWLFGLILLGWQLLALFEACATYVDASHGGHAVALRSLWLTLMLQYLPLVLSSWVLALVFTRFQETILRPPQLMLALLLSMAVFLPFLTGSDILIVLLRDGRPASDFPAMLARGGRMVWWYNIFVVGLAFLAQAMYTSWWRAQQQELSAQRAYGENLALRLGLLQGQMKPHFLFNALNTISALVRTADCTLADHALGKLGELLNYALAAGKGVQSSVADELVFLRAYLALQGLRYGERMHLVWSIEERDWTCHACPPLLFQPLAENAVHHGVEPQHQRCSIHITLEYLAGMVSLRIANPVLAAPRARHGLGLTATRERLAILYGQRADLSIDANEHNYTIQLRFPANDDQPA